MVLPDGEVWDGLRGLRKNNTGYDLKQLFIGSEGTLGIITAAVLKLSSAAGDGDGLAGHRLGACGDTPAERVPGGVRHGADGVELVSDVSLGLVLKNIRGARAPLADSPWHLLVELSGPGEDAALRESLERFLEGALETGGIADAVVAQSGEQASNFGYCARASARRRRSRIQHQARHFWVPVSCIGEFLDRAGAALRSAYPGIRIVAFGHVGDGNLHYNQSKPEAGENAAFIAAQSQVNRIVHDIVHDLGGSISAEHGIGQLKREELQRYKSAVELDMMRAVKRALDPQGIMNPGKVL